MSPFTNVSIFDRYFLESLTPSYILNGKTPTIKTIQMIQRIYVDAMNDELSRSPLTFEEILPRKSLKTYNNLKFNVKKKKEKS